jgi:hypothetical protein
MAKAGLNLSLYPETDYGVMLGRAQAPLWLTCPWQGPQKSLENLMRGILYYLLWDVNGAGCQSPGISSFMGFFKQKKCKLFIAEYCKQPDTHYKY